MFIYNKKYTKKIVGKISFDFLSKDISKDLKKSIDFGISNCAIFPTNSNALSIFRNAVFEAITDIEKKGEILYRFLKLGPYWKDGDIPENSPHHFLSDEETGKAVSFIYGHIVNSFQGRLAELLSIEPCLILLKELQKKNTFLKNTKLFVGDSLLTERIDLKGVAKGADFHFADINPSDNIAHIYGVGEVKSYPCSQTYLKQQLQKHESRVKNGFYALGKYFLKDNIMLGENNNRNVIKISIVPSSWHLTRDFYFGNNGTSLYEIPNVKNNSENIIKQIGKNEWRIIHKWSHEALAQESYELTFWYMAKLGELIFANEMPRGIKNMTPGEAGKNAAKEMLYFSILRARSWYEEQRAIALYNTYGFGYSLGMNYKNKKGKRELLYVEALNEIKENGEDRFGCKIWK